MATDIVTLDPGLTIGIAGLLDGERYLTNQLVPLEYPHPHETVFDVLSELAPKKIIYERFDFRAAKNGAVLTGVEFIGVIEFYAQVKCIEVLKMSASDGKAFWNDNKLRMLGLYHRGKPHANDATRILLTHRMKTEPDWMKSTTEFLHDQLVK